MAYDNHDLYDDDIDLDEQAKMYESDLYENGFREHLGPDPYQDTDLTDEEILAEEGFGESLNPTSNPHIDDQFNDPKLQAEAEADYTEPNNPKPEDPSLLDKAKDKIQGWTDKDK